MEVYAGLDLHSTNTYVAMINKDNKVLYKQRLRRDKRCMGSYLQERQTFLSGNIILLTGEL